MRQMRFGYGSGGGAQVGNSLTEVSLVGIFSHIVIGSFNSTQQCLNLAVSIKCLTQARSAAALCSKHM